MIERHVRSVPEVAWDIVDNAISPTTIIYPEGVGLATGVCAQDGSVGIRKVNEPYTASLIQMLGRPLLSTSANVSGNPTPENLEEMEQDL